MAEKLVKYLVIPGIIGPIFFFVLLTILGFLWSGYDPITTGMSELGAVDSPFKDIMNYLGFSLLGLFIIAFSIGYKLYLKSNLLMMLGFIILLIGGIFLFLVGFFPCDAQCIDVTLIGELHSLISMISAITISVAVILSAQPISLKWGKNWGYVSFILGILSLASGPIMFIEYLDNYSGLIQRLGIGLSLLWIFITSIKMSLELRNPS